MSFPKSRGDGDYQTAYSEFALNQTTGFTEGLVEFEEQIWNNALEEHLDKQGAACITLLTFQNNDKNESAGAALARVWKSAKGSGFDLFTQGECNAKLHAKAKEILQEDESAESGPALDEKMQAAFKLSFALQEKMNETMVTKDDLAKVGEAMATKDDLTKIDETVDEMSLKMVTKEEFIRMKDTLTAAFSKINSSQTQTIFSLQETAKKLEEIIVTKDRDVSNQAQTIKELETVVITKDRDVSNQAQTIKELETVVITKDRDVFNQAQTIKELETVVITKDRDVSNQAQTIKELETVVITKDRDVSNQAQTIKELETVVITKDRDVSNQAQTIKELEERNYSQRCVLARLNQEKTADANIITKLNEKIQSKDKIIIDLMEKNQALASGSSQSILEEKIYEMHTFMKDYVVSEESRKRKAP